MRRVCEPTFTITASSMSPERIVQLPNSIVDSAKMSSAHRQNAQCTNARTRYPSRVVPRARQRNSTSLMTALWRLQERMAPDRRHSPAANNNSPPRCYQSHGLAGDAYLWGIDGCGSKKPLDGNGHCGRSRIRAIIRFWLINAA